MHMLYNSDSFTVVAFDLPGAPAAAGAEAPEAQQRGGFEIVDKFAQKDIFIQGAMAASFQAGVEALMEDQAERGGHRRVHRPLRLADAAAARPALTAAAPPLSRNRRRPRRGARDLLPDRRRRPRRRGGPARLKFDLAPSI